MSNDLIEREAFEAWAESKGWRTDRRYDMASPDEYMAYETQQRWECWQAAYQRAQQPTGASKCAECSGTGQVWDVSGAGPWACYACAPQPSAGVVMPELAECWKLADQIANGSHFDSVPNHDDDSLYDLLDCGDPCRLRLQAERADDLAKMLAKLLARLNGKEVNK